MKDTYQNEFQKEKKMLSLLFTICMIWFIGTFFIFGLNTGDRFGDKTIYLRRGRIDFHVDLCYNINEYITSTKTPNHYDMERVNSFLSEVSDDFVNYVKDVINGNE